MARRIAVYADWIGLPEALMLGWLHAQRGAGREWFVESFRAVVRQWARPADALKIPAREQERMAGAFRLAA